ncbi:Na+/H+ antiporter, partial [Coemansia sp. RSA 486]
MGEIGIHVEQPQLVPALVGGFVLILGHCSLITKERLFLSETLLAMVYGIVIGPSVLKWIDPAEWSSNDLQLTQEFSRYCLAIEVMIAGVTLPKRYLKTEWISLLMLLLPVMTVMWIISGSIVKVTFDMP